MSNSTDYPDPFIQSIIDSHKQILAIDKEFIVFQEDLLADPDSYPDDRLFFSLLDKTFDMVARVNAILNASNLALLNDIQLKGRAEYPPERIAYLSVFVCRWVGEMRGTLADTLISTAQLASSGPAYRLEFQAAIARAQDDLDKIVKDNSKEIGVEKVKRKAAYRKSLQQQQQGD